jgi:hypothetical protein
LGVGLTTLPCKRKIVEKPPRNSAGFCGGGQGLSWAVEPRKERKILEKCGMKLRIGLSCLRIWSNGSICKHGDERSVSINAGDFLTS